MKFEIKSRLDDSVLFTAEIDATESTPDSIRLGLAARTAYRSGCDLRYADLRSCDLSGRNLRDADLSGADLSGADLSGAALRGCDLRDADLNGCDLRDADLRDADLRYVDLRDADLNGCDLSGAALSELPAALTIPNLDAKILAAIEGGGALNMRQWHTCERTHCRGGWAIHLAGDAGKTLESAIGPCAAGALIYHLSTGRIPDFYASNEDALADIRKCAEVPNE